MTESLRQADVATTSSTGERRLFAIATAVGLGLGVLSTLADGLAGGRALGILGNTASPWGLAAFLVGSRTTSAKRGAIAGGLTLLVGVVTYYMGAGVRGIVFGGGNLVWTVTALVAGPFMGWCGAAVARDRGRPPLIALAAPAAMMASEALFLMIQSRIWAADFAAENYRLIDAGMMLALLLGGMALPLELHRDRRRLARVYVLVLLGSVAGAFAFQLLYRLIVAVP